MESYEIVRTFNDWLKFGVWFAVKLKHDTENSESVGGSVAVGDSIAKAGAVLGVVVDKMQLQRIGNLLQERERKTQRVEVDSDSIIISLDVVNPHFFAFREYGRLVVPLRLCARILVRRRFPSGNELEQMHRWREVRRQKPSQKKTRTMLELSFQKHPCFDGVRSRNLLNLLWIELDRKPSHRDDDARDFLPIFPCVVNTQRTWRRLLTLAS